MNLKLLLLTTITLAVTSVSAGGMRTLRAAKAEKDMSGEFS